MYQKIKSVLFVIGGTKYHVVDFDMIEQAIRRCSPWPEAEIRILDVGSTGPFRFLRPELRSADLPWVGTPTFRFVSSELKAMCHIFPQDGDSTGEIREKTFGTVINTVTQGDVDEWVRSSDIIVNCTKGHRGDLIFRHILDCEGKNFPALSAWRIYSAVLPVLPQWGVAEPLMERLSRQTSANSALIKVLCASEFTEGATEAGGRVSHWTGHDASLRYQEGKEFIDYHWDVNAGALLSRTLQESGGNPRGVEVLRKKHALMLILAMRRGSPDGQIVANEPTDEAEIVRAMANWRGTGKYNPNVPFLFGNPQTHVSMIERMLVSGLLERPAEATWNASNSVSRLLSSTHGSALVRLVEALMECEHAGVGLTFRDVLLGSEQASVGIPASDNEAKVVEEATAEVFRTGMMSDPITRENMESLRIMRRSRSGLRLSVAGERFADRLGKDAYDPDLLFRLHGWCSEWPNSRPVVEAYIRRYFGRMKRALGMHNLAFGTGNNEAVPDISANEELTRRAQISSSATSDTPLTPGQRRALALAVRRDGPKT